MHLDHLQVTHFRNIDRADLDFSQRLNLVYGDNGSGKTSLLEAIATLARGHSFRTRKFTYLINNDAKQFSLFGRADGEDGPRQIGIQRDRFKGSQFKLDGHMIQRSTELARALPILVLDSELFSLLDGGPTTRRRFLDWLVFHVKHEFSSVWSEYSRVLKHRNALLRHDRIQLADLEPWDTLLARLGTELDQHRRECVDLFLPQLITNLNKQHVHWNSTTLDYVPGWNPENPLLDQYRDSFKKDALAGSTSLGPHRSDLKITVNDKSPHEVLSRGQQKTLTSAMFLALLETFKVLTGRAAIVLVDDLPAELDSHNRRHLMQTLAGLESQVFATGIDLNQLADGWPPEVLHRAKVFHVKHGRFHIHDRSSGENYE